MWKRLSKTHQIRKRPSTQARKDLQIHEPNLSRFMLSFATSSTNCTSRAQATCESKDGHSWVAQAQRLGKGSLLNWILSEDFAEDRYIRGWWVWSRSMAGSWGLGDQRWWGANDHRRVKHVRKELWKMGNKMLRTNGGEWNHLLFTPNPHGEKDIETLVVSRGGFLETLERARGSGRLCSKIFWRRYSYPE